MTMSKTVPHTIASVNLHTTALSSPSAQHDSDGFGVYDLEIREGKIASVIPARDKDWRKHSPIVMPTFIDCHTHLDKGHIWARRPNPDGSFMGALNSVGEDRAANWEAHDVEARMEFALKCAYAHGTKAIRTHLDSVPPQETISWPVFEAVRERWKGRIELQAACLFGIDQARDEDWFRRLVAIVKRHRGVLGAVTYMMPDLDELLDRIFRAAIENGLELDFHADETDDVEAVSLGRIAAAARRHKFEGRILIGHCCSLARQPDSHVLHTLDQVAASNISVVSLPMCNMYLQDRRADGTTPRWRGVTLLHEMKARGINVAVASDNTRDPFHAYGDLDMLEVYRMATRTIHFDHPVGDWPNTVLSNPAKALGISAGKLDPGTPADFILFKGRSWTELLSRPESQRVVYRDGAPIDAALPAYEELDHLMEPAR
jgi:cytosine deaminase